MKIQNGSNQKGKAMSCMLNNINNEALIKSFNKKCRPMKIQIFVANYYF